MIFRKANKKNAKNVALIGARGAGKSTLARRLEKLSQWPVMSTDMLVSRKKNGLSIAQITDQSGWFGFRQLEYEVLKNITQMKNIIIDCGGGILVDVPSQKKTDDLEEFYSESKAELLRKHCHVIYLKCSKSALLLQNKPSAERPALLGNYEEILEKRFSFYEKSADFILCVEKQSLEGAAKILYEKYFSRKG